MPWHNAPIGNQEDHMKINQSVLIDKDTKDAITYQNWCWDLTVYHHAGVLRPFPSPLCHLFFTRLPRGPSEKFRDRHHPG